MSVSPSVGPDVSFVGGDAKSRGMGGRNLGLEGDLGRLSSLGRRLGFELSACGGEGEDHSPPPAALDGRSDGTWGWAVATEAGMLKNEEEPLLAVADGLLGASFSLSFSAAAAASCSFSFPLVLEKVSFEALRTIDRFVVPSEWCC